MKVEIVPKNGRKGVFIIVVDEEPWKEVHSSIFGYSPSFPKTAASLEEWKEIFHAAEYRCAKAYVLKRLGMQSYFSVKLEKLLHEKLVTPETIFRLIEECKNLGYLDDQAWVEGYTKSCFKKSGKRVVLSKLLAKGVPLETAKKTVVDSHHPDEEKQAILHLLKTRYRSRDLTDAKEKQKVIASLIRKGYSYEQILELL